MLTKGDEYPLHQTPDPIAFAGSDRNFYDRYFFNGYTPDGTLMFGAALGVYPVLNIMDAALTVRHDGVQHNLRFSKEMGAERLDMQLGALGLEVIEPLHKLRLHIAENEHGIHGELVCTGRHKVMHEPRTTTRLGSRVLLDATRLTQNVDWAGEIRIKDTVLSLDTCQGTRDRSWGIRPVGLSDPHGATYGAAPQYYWLWTPMNFAEHMLFYYSAENGLGEPYNCAALLVERATGAEHHFSAPARQVEYEPGTRRVRRLTLDLQNATMRAKAELIANAEKLYMSGMGYMHPEWGHGTPHGPLAMQYDSYQLADTEAALGKGDITYLHVQAHTKAQLVFETQSHKGAHKGTHDGIGALEQLFIGPHAPSGFKDFLDTAK